MKKLILILGIITFSCTQEESLPAPQVTQPTTNTHTIVYNLEGTYNCYNWVADQTTGITTHLEIDMHTQTQTNISFTLNQYLSSGMVQLINSRSASIDSNYFDTGSTLMSQRYKGYLVNDSTLRVTEYAIGATGQTKDFIKE